MTKPRNTLIPMMLVTAVITSSCWESVSQMDGPGTDSDSNTDSGTGTELGSDTDTDSDIDSDSDTGSDSDTDSKTHPDTDTEGPSWWLHSDYGSLVYVSWYQTSPGKTHVEYQVDDTWQQAPEFDASYGMQRQLIVGIPYDMNAEWKVVHPGGVIDGPTITTDPVPTGLPLGTVIASNPSLWWSEGNYLLTSINQDGGGWTGGTYWTFIIDREGRPVWARKTPLSHWTLYTQVAQSGDHILWDEATFWSDFDHGAGSRVHFTYLDEEFDIVDTPGLHHAFVQLPDETLVWGSQDHGGWEALVEKAPGSVDENIIWTAKNDWPGAVVGWGGNQVESNGLFYYEATDSFLYSFYTNDSVVEVDRMSGSSLWWAGEVANGYSFSPPGSQFEWQHGVSYTDTGNLLLSTRRSGSTPVYEYEVNHDTQTLELVWQYDPGVYASTNGDAWRLPNGNTLHLLGSASHIVEVTSKGDIVWRLDYGDLRLLGRGEFIEDLYDLVSP